MSPARTLLAVLAFALAGCAAGERASLGAPANRNMLAVIQGYYELNAAEQNNACRMPIMSGITRSTVASETADQVVVDVTYKYGNFTNRSNERCRGIGNRTFTLMRTPSGFRVIDMTGERRRGASWRLW